MFEPSRPPFSYYGGKQRLASKIVPLIPKHTVYVEPFCGAATIMFKKPYLKITNTHHYREVINDTNGLVVNFFRVLQDEEKGRVLCEKLFWTPYSKKEHGLSLNDPEIDDIEKARRFFISINCSFCNRLDSGFRRSVFGRNVASDFLIKSEVLFNFRKRLLSVTVDDIDALKCLKHWDSPQTFFYVDPPYVTAEQGHYSGYTQQDFDKLVEVLNELKGSFILSCYGFENPYKWQEFRFDAVAAASAFGCTYGARETTKKQTADKLGNRTRVEYVYKR